MASSFILIDKRKAILFVVFASLVTIGIGTLSYRTVSAIAVLGEKAAAERLLYLGIVTLVTVAVLIIWLFVDHIVFARQMATAIEMVRREGALPEQKLERLGSVGKSVQLLFTELQAKNTALQNRVDAQGQLIAVVVRWLDKPVCVTDVRGKVLYASPSFIAKEELRAGDQLNRAVEGLSMSEIVRLLDRTGEVHRVGKSGFYPITDQKGLVNYVLYAPNSTDLPRYVATRQMTKPRRGLFQSIRRRRGGR